MSAIKYKDYNNYKSYYKENNKKYSFAELNDNQIKIWKDKNGNTFTFEKSYDPDPDPDKPEPKPQPKLKEKDPIIALNEELEKLRMLCAVQAHLLEEYRKKESQNEYDACTLAKMKGRARALIDQLEEMIGKVKGLDPKIDQLIDELGMEEDTKEKRTAIEVKVPIQV